MTDGKTCMCVHVYRKADGMCILHGHGCPPDYNPPTEGNHTEEPTEGNHTEEPTEGKITEEPTEGNHTEEPTEGYSNIDMRVRHLISELLKMPINIPVVWGGAHGTDEHKWPVERLHLGRDNIGRRAVVLGHECYE